MFSVPITNNNNKREQEETFGVDGYVYGIDYGNNFMNVYLSPKSSSCIC